MDLRQVAQAHLHQEAYASHPHHDPLAHNMSVGLQADNRHYHRCRLVAAMATLDPGRNMLDAQTRSDPCKRLSPGHYCHLPR